MKRVTLLLLFLIFSVNCFSQSKNTEELKTWLHEKAAITYLNNDFYNCANQILETNESGTVMNELLVSLCADEAVVKEAKFSDEGKKAAALLNFVFIENCVENNSGLGSEESTVLCGCLFSKMVNEKVGIKKIISESYQNSEEYKSLEISCKQQSD
ncbi:hypothetical protein [Gracilimonas sediminicola]|uniref:hypothetical protein n=1 Tax=Gracilimonas sediminicola TaxID=2952158 RepID=UPI0038D4F8CA